MNTRLRSVAPPPPPPPPLPPRGPALGRPLRVVNLGLEVFAEELERAGVPVVRVEYRPPAGGDERLARLLEALE